MSNFSPALEIVAELPVAPGNLTFTPEGRLILSLHQFYDPELRVVEWTPEGLIPFPNLDWNQPSSALGASLDSVLGMQCDANGVVWMLDNALRGGSTPKLVGWDTAQNQLAQVIELPAPITPPQQFINDLAVDLDHNAIYISDPAAGDLAALIVVDLKTGTARRVLQGHASVAPGTIDLIIDDEPVLMAQPDGSLARPHLGVNAIALDASNEWLYFGPMHGTSISRIKTTDVSNAQLSDPELGERVEYYCEKPVCDGISLDMTGNIYLGDLAANAVGVIAPDLTYRHLVSEARTSWLDCFSFSPTGELYFVSNQLHRSAPLHGGTDISRPPYHIFRIQPLAPGVTGR